MSSTEAMKRKGRGSQDLWIGLDRIWMDLEIIIYPLLDGSLS
jgi:hypothetical protein